MDVPKNIIINDDDVKFFTNEKLSMYLSIMQKVSNIKYGEFIDYEGKKGKVLDHINVLRNNIFKWAKKNRKVNLLLNSYGYISVEDLFFKVGNPLDDYINGKTNEFTIAEFCVLSFMKDWSIIVYYFDETNNNCTLSLFESFISNKYGNTSYDDLIKSPKAFVLIKNMNITPYSYGIYSPQSHLQSQSQSQDEQLGGNPNLKQGGHDINILSKRSIKMFNTQIFPLATRLFINTNENNTNEPNVPKIFNGMPTFSTFYIMNKDNVPSYVQNLIKPGYADNVFSFSNDNQSHILYIISHTPRIQDIESINDIKFAILYYKDNIVSEVNLYTLNKRFIFKYSNYIHTLILNYSDLDELMSNIQNGLTVGKCGYITETKNVYIEALGDIGTTAISRERNISVKPTKLFIKGGDTYGESQLYDMYYDFQRLIKLLNMNVDDIKLELVM